MNIWWRIARFVYPKQWRLRYGRELETLLTDVRPTLNDGLDVIRGGVAMRLEYSGWIGFVAAFGAAGLCVAVATAWATPKQFVSHGLMTISVPTSGDGDPLYVLSTKAFSDQNLDALVRAHNFHDGEAQASINNLRKSVRVNRLSNTAIQISVSNSDSRTAQQLTEELMSLIARAAEQSAIAATVIDQPDAARKAERRNLPLFAAIGLFAGATLGAMTALVRRHVNSR